ncbi:sulfurtransferase [Xanthomonas hyacinthi]|uniref:Sulfurtransferase n=1 Tax=Xanthomonas hyacinthi TaxID=56455 RepID=A0A2S7F3B6_9XANT|nr:rhodanese-like domain-containing protein [Xanthomonas hyacinthi]PPU99931.1 sulfurtransferase [Xanthomonas hyacinthi]QGY76103.1 sulfurtransferase [Xanthomonas hyacinthi]
MSAPATPLIDVATLAAQLDAPRLRLFDASVELPAPRFDGDYRPASGADGWRQAHIPGARHADLLHALSDPQAGFGFALPERAALLAALQRLGIGDGCLPVLYDRSDGFWAARLWWMLRSVGIDAQVLDGGWRAWRGAGLPSASGEPATPASASASAMLTAAPRPAAWVDRRYIEAVLAGDAAGTLVCALSAPLFAGRAPSRYARRGHIPGSRNLPARALFDAAGHYLPPAQLARILAPLQAAARPLLLYCGGGISAAAVGLALSLLGETAVAVYDGSLQEWAADPALPLVALANVSSASERASDADAGAAMPRATDGSPTDAAEPRR